MKEDFDDLRNKIWDDDDDGTPDAFIETLLNSGMAVILPLAKRAKKMNRRRKKLPEPLPCPFCGRKAYTIDGYANQHVGCRPCSIGFIHLGTGDRLAYLIKRWNRRAIIRMPVTTVDTSDRDAIELDLIQDRVI